MKGANFQALPHSEESERAVLAAILLSPTVLDQVVEVLEVRDLYLEKHQLIYGSMVDLWKEGHSIDLRTVQAKLELQNSFELIGGLPYLTGLDTFLPDISRVMEYAEVVKERSARRHLMAMAANVSSACVSSGLEAKDILAEAERELGTIWVGEASEWVSAGEAFEESDRIRKEQRDGTRPMLFTGIQALDRITGAIEAGEMLVIGGNPKMGKSSLMRQFLIEAAKRGPVLLATLEETTDQVMPKMACCMSGVDYNDWRREQISQEDEENYWRARNRLTEFDIRLVGLGDPKRKNSKRRYWPDIERIIRKADRKKNLVASAIDFIQLLVKGENTNWELENMTSGYASLCGSLRMVGIAVSQLNQDNARRKFKKGGEETSWQEHIPQLNDLRGSGGISQAASKVYFPFRPRRFAPNNPEFKPYDGMEKAFIYLAANRNGPTGEANVWWQGGTMSYWDTVQQGASW